MVALPHKLRIESPGAVYHVMIRVDRREDIFLDDVDRQARGRGIKTLAEACQKTGWEVPADCLRRNHFHLVAEIPDANLVEGMRWLLSASSIRLNHRHKLFGHVFSGRLGTSKIANKGCTNRCGAKPSRNRPQ